MALLDARLWLAALMLLIAAAAGGYWKGAKDTRAEHAVSLLKATEAARRTEHALQEKADGIRIEGEAARRRIAGDLERARDGLRQRAERLPEAARPSCAGSTGAELSRRDAEAALRLAARADELRAALDACQAWATTVTTYSDRARR